jgi:hypothetical protein
LQHTQQLRTPERPTVLQQDVVLLLDANPGQFAQDIELVGQLLKLYELDLPIELLLARNRLKGDGGVAVPTASIMKNDV